MRVEDAVISSRSVGSVEAPREAGVLPPGCHSRRRPSLLVDDTDEESPRACDGPDESGDRLDPDPVQAAALAVREDDRGCPEQAARGDAVPDGHATPGRSR